jgi:hypothetical protein
LAATAYSSVRQSHSAQRLQSGNVRGIASRCSQSSTYRIEAFLLREGSMHCAILATGWGSSRGQGSSNNAASSFQVHLLAHSGFAIVSEIGIQWNGVGRVSARSLYWTATEELARWSAETETRVREEFPTLHVIRILWSCSVCTNSFSSLSADKNWFLE